MRQEIQETELSHVAVLGLGRSLVLRPEGGVIVCLLCINCGASSCHYFDGRDLSEAWRG